MDYYRELMQKIHQAWQACDCCFNFVVFRWPAGVRACDEQTSCWPLPDFATSSSCRIAQSWGNATATSGTVVGWMKSVEMPLHLFTHSLACIARRFYVHSESQELPPPYATQFNCHQTHHNHKQGRSFCHRFRAWLSGLCLLRVECMYNRYGTATTLPEFKVWSSLWITVAERNVLCNEDGEEGWLWCSRTLSFWLLL